MDNNATTDNWIPGSFRLSEIPSGHDGYRTLVRVAGGGEWDWDEVAVWVRPSETVEEAVRRCQTVQDLYGPDFEVADRCERVI